MGEMICFFCGGPYCEATGHVYTLRVRACERCFRGFLRWFRGHINRTFGGVRFYDCAVARIEVK